jgi:MoaA/NifB/PqqE/SkfB family radical SAM enzyme
MDIYKILRINNYIKSHRIKFLGLFLLNLFDKRYLSIQLDPILACNFKCKMCYFSDPEYVRNNLKGVFAEEELEQIAKVNFKNALKLQIGCGTEPTLFKHNKKLIEIAKKYKVPYISMITNGSLLNEKDIEEYSVLGLNEIILSMHGVTKKTYEEFMEKGDYDKFTNAIKHISDYKKINPNLRLRINYTFNEDNFFELRHFFEYFGNYNIDFIQLRPIDKIVNTTYSNFSLKSIEKEYAEVVNLLNAEAKKRNIVLMYPESIIREEASSLVVKTKNNSSYLMPYTYCYVSPKYFWKDDFDWKNESFLQWKKRNKWSYKLFRNIFISKENLEKPNRNMLNYEV